MNQMENACKALLKRTEHKILAVKACKNLALFTTSILLINVFDNRLPLKDTVNKAVQYNKLESSIINLV